MDQIKKIERALISVFYKDGIDEIAAALTSRGAELLSTGGTYDYLAQKGFAVKKVEDWITFRILVIVMGKIDNHSPLRRPRNTAVVGYLFNQAFLLITFLIGRAGMITGCITKSHYAAGRHSEKYS